MRVALLFIALIISGCIQFPKSPDIDVCEILPRPSTNPIEYYVHCYSLKKPGDEGYELPIIEAIGFLAVSPKHYGAAKKYIEKLRDELHECQQGI